MLSAFALPTPRKLLHDAARIYDHDAELQRAATLAWRNGFASGAQWMAMALSRVRGSHSSIVCNEGREPRRYQALGILKYALAATAAAACLFAGILLRSALLIASAPILFYVAEVQTLFLFPCALDGSATPFRDSRALLRRAGGTLRATATVMVLATVMLFGGLFGRGFVRCWCLGCLAVCICYDAVLHLPRGGSAQ